MTVLMGLCDIEPGRNLKYKIIANRTYIGKVSLVEMLCSSVLCGKGSLKAFEISFDG